MTSLRWVLFDLNGTLLDPASIADALDGRERDAELAHGALDDAVGQAMADTLTGGFRPFTDHLGAALERRLALADRPTDVVAGALRRAKEMDPFPDAAAALERLSAAGLDVGVLTNSAADTAEAALQAAGLREHLGAVIGADAVGAYKPDARLYGHALAQLRVAADEACLVAAHGWDVHGARRVGLRAAWVARRERVLSTAWEPPDVRAADLAEAADAIVADLSG